MLGPGFLGGFLYHMIVISLASEGKQSFLHDGSKPVVSNSWSDFIAKLVETVKPLLMVKWDVQGLPFVKIMNVLFVRSFASHSQSEPHLIYLQCPFLQAIQSQ